MKQKQILQLSLFVVFFFALLLAGWFFFAKQKAAANTVVNQSYDSIMEKDQFGQNAKARFDYYMLALSWSPAFCEQQREQYGNNLPANSAYQCGSTQKFGWVVHGLWPQNGNARRVSDHPRYCQGDLPMVDRQLIEKYLADSPSASLLQGEWEKHGACAFNNAEQYFDKEHELFRALKLPSYELSRKELFRWLRENNPSLANRYLGASRNEIYICYGLNWQVIDCPRTGNYQLNN